MRKKAFIVLLCIALWAGMSVPSFAATDKAVEQAEVARDLDELGEAMKVAEPEAQKGLENFQQKELLLFAEQGALRDSFGASNVAYYEPLEEYVLQYESPEQTRDAYRALLKEFGETKVVVNLPVRTESYSQTVSRRTTADSVSWGNDAMMLDALRDKANSGGGPGGKVVVGVVDSGARPTQNLLKGRISSDSAAVEKYAVKDPVPYRDQNGHGTHVAGIIADGTSRQVELLIVKATDSQGCGDFNSLLVGMEYAAKHGARVINVSFGGDRYTNGGLSAAAYQAILDSYEKRINRICSTYDCMVVVAAGNRNTDIDTSKTFPACFPVVITVGALGKDLKRASFSNYGSTMDFGAPGVEVYSGGIANDDSMAVASGTSMAAPHVAAAAAMVRLYKPGLNRTEAEDVMRSRAVDITPKGLDKYTGCGMITLGDSSLPTSFSLKGATASAGPATWTGKALTPTVKVVWKGRTLTQGREFTTAYTNNKKIGAGKFTVRGRGRYTGTLKGTFRIVPRGTSLTRYRPGQKKLTLYWKKQRKQTSGYQIQISGSVPFGAKTRAITVSKNKKSKVRIGKLKRRHVYYVRIRTYKKVGKTRYYSAWSRAGIVRTT